MTLGLEQSRLLFILLNLAWIPLAIVAIRRRGPALMLIPMAALWLMLAHTSAHKALIAYMGHGTELAMAGIFLYRALTGIALEREYERPIYSTLACPFTLISCASYAESAKSYNTVALSETICIIRRVFPA